MKKLSITTFVGILFSAIGTVSLLLSREILTAAIWLSFGNGLILSGLRFTAKDEHGNVYVKPVPKIRLAVSVFLIVLAVALLGLQVYLDLNSTDAKIN
ncbi:hypothetical protein ACFSKU_11645 [Pontibacter silvestris]|uniref:Uncharacterized protein n=1 Tax=Pontibacter silvestris TaxID=2305183 RepID=A0ABW4WXV6_9BACT|nr:hypothetical protein [Pontibacter silvestris]MCC9135329.1 hypothetical protein [Pontibacter silvestris]